MKKNHWIVLGCIVAAVLLLALFVGGTYNNIVGSSQEVNAQWSNLQTQYQRRADVIPNLASVVSGAIKSETATQTKIAEVRSQATAAKAAVSSASNPSELQAAGAQVETAIAGFRSLNINVENYPELRQIESILSLQDELAGTENRVQVSRERYNTAVKNYNVLIMRFPTNILAGMFGFDEREFFEARTGAEVAPVVTIA